jgi:hypothetical protein
MVCSECGHPLRAEAGSLAAFRVINFFDYRTMRAPTRLMANVDNEGTANNSIIKTFGPL